MKTYKVSIEVRVSDEQALIEAARKHAKEVDGLDDDQISQMFDLDEEGGAFGVETALLTLLDPGILSAGSEVIHSEVEQVYDENGDPTLP